jgi:hypothetical protein
VLLKDHVAKSGQPMTENTLIANRHRFASASQRIEK